MSRPARLGSPVCRLPRDKAPARSSFVRRPIPCLRCETAKSPSTTSRVKVSQQAARLPIGASVRQLHHRCWRGVPRGRCVGAGRLFLDRDDGRELDLVHDAGHRSGDGSVGVGIAPNRGAERRVGHDRRRRPAGHRRAGAQGRRDLGAYSMAARPSRGVLPRAAPRSSASVTVASGCAWTASSRAAWVTVVAGASGAGNGAVAFSGGESGQRPHRVPSPWRARRSQSTQAAAATTPCTYTIASAGGRDNHAGRDRNRRGVDSRRGCAWTASSNAAWVTVASGASGTGAGAVAFSVAPNPGAARTAPSPSPATRSR